MKIRHIFILLVAISISQFTRAQDLTVQDYTAAWENMSKMVLETAEKMPAEAYTYKPNDKVRSFAEQMNHLSRSNIGLGSMVFGAMPKFKFNKNKPPTEKTEIMALLKNSFEYFKDNLAGMSNEDLTATIGWGRPGSGMKTTKHKGLLMIFSHLQLEYGKTTIYARANNVEPAPSAGWKFF